jgi:hypothetical protein
MVAFLSGSPVRCQQTVSQAQSQVYQTDTKGGNGEPGWNRYCFDDGITAMGRPPATAGLRLAEGAPSISGKTVVFVILSGAKNLAVGNRHGRFFAA